MLPAALFIAESPFCIWASVFDGKYQVKLPFSDLELPMILNDLHFSSGQWAKAFLLRWMAKKWKRFPWPHAGVVLGDLSCFIIFIHTITIFSGGSLLIQHWIFGVPDSQRKFILGKFFFLHNKRRCNIHPLNWRWTLKKWMHYRMWPLLGSM